LHSFIVQAGKTELQKGKKRSKALHGPAYLLGKKKRGETKNAVQYGKLRGGDRDDGYFSRDIAASG